jgi:hypothetical protein
MARLVRRDAMDRSFDLEFWSRVGPEGRFAAAWDMVCETEAMHGRDAGQPGLQRSVFRAKRR